MKVTILIFVNREWADDIGVYVDFELEYDSGEYLEANHPTNGYGSGWTAEYLGNDREMTLTAQEIDLATTKAINENT